MDKRTKERAAKLLRRARGLISSFSHWNTGSFRSGNDKGEETYCVLGAVRKAAGCFNRNSPPLSKVGHLASDTLEKVSTEMFNRSVISKNDSTYTKENHKDILKLLTKAAKKVGK